jgi:glycosyltransferase involved in cell wall biosynthesis
MSAIRLGIVLDGPLSFDGTYYCTNLPMGRYCERLARVFGQIDIYAPVHAMDSVDHLPNLEFKIKSEFAEIIVLPPGGGSVASEPLHQVELFKVYGEHFPKNDWIVFFGVSSYRMAGILEARLRGRPYSIYFGSDWSENTQFTYRFGPTSGLGYWLYVNSGVFFEKISLAGSRFALTAGRALQEKVAKSGIPTHTTSPRMNLSIDDCFEREDTCQGQEITIFFAGGLLPRKGLRHLIEATAVLRQKGLPIVVRLAGEGPHRENLEALVRKHGLEGQIEFLGHLTNGAALWEGYRSADIFVLPTLAEGFPRVLYEAMSQSIPIVTTRVSGIPYLMEDGKNALLVDAEDTVALIDAIERVATDPKL